MRSTFLTMTDRYAGAQHRRALWQLTNTLVSYAALLFLMYQSLSISYALTLMISIPAAALLMRLFIIQHDCGHQAFFREKWQNDLLGSVIGVLTLTPYEYWLRQHARHHATTGDLDRRGDGDILTLTVSEYRDSAVARRIWYRIYRNPIFLFFIGAPIHFLVLQRLPLGHQMKEARPWITVMLTNGAIAGAVIGFAYWIGLGAVLLIYLPVVTFSAAIGTWLFYVQHQFEFTYWRRSPDWDFEEAAMLGSSYYALPRVLHWFTGNIGYHHIHHLRSKVPNYRLRECYEENPPLQTAPTLTLWQSLRSLRLALWDEHRQRLIGFAALKNVDA